MVLPLPEPARLDNISAREQLGSETGPSRLPGQCQQTSLKNTQNLCQKGIIINNFNIKHTDFVNWWIHWFSVYVESEQSRFSADCDGNCLPALLEFFPLHLCPPARHSQTFHTCPVKTDTGWERLFSHSDSKSQQALPHISHYKKKPNE